MELLVNYAYSVNLPSLCILVGHRPRSQRTYETTTWPSSIYAKQHRPLCRTRGRHYSFTGCLGSILDVQGLIAPFPPGHYYTQATNPDSFMGIDT